MTGPGENETVDANESRRLARRHALGGPILAIAMMALGLYVAEGTEVETLAFPAMLGACLVGILVGLRSGPWTSANSSNGVGQSVGLVMTFGLIGAIAALPDAARPWARLTIFVLACAFMAAMAASGAKQLVIRLPVGDAGSEQG
ncbi:MAG TPA: hypothetical protein VFK41_09045 [Nocardioidaceae bacterium]|nr:hypothetical protein [Nocardioidaceae bacterium]